MSYNFLQMLPIDFSPESISVCRNFHFQNWAGEYILPSRLEFLGLRYPDWASSRNSSNHD